MLFILFLIGLIFSPSPEQREQWKAQREQRAVDRTPTPEQKKQPTVVRIPSILLFQTMILGEKNVRLLFV